MQGMNIGVLSDIHADLEALTLALDRLQRIHRVDQILCAGDIVGRGAHHDEVVQLIRDRRIPTVRGNHDEWNYPLRADNKLFLRDLPLEWRGTFEGVNFYMTHGKPGNNLWGLYRDHTSNTLLNMMLADLRADVIITGHTHTPLYARVANGCVINPGSLYRFASPRSTSHSYGVFRLPERTFHVFDLNCPPDEQIRVQQ